MADNKGQKKKFKLFDFNRDGRGISKKVFNENKSGLKRFFSTFANNFTKILYVNIFFVLGNFPAIGLIAALSGFSQATSTIPMLDIFHNMIPVFNTAEPSAFSMTLYALTGLQEQILVPTVWTYILIGLGCLVIFTFGPVNVGTAYILRNIAKGDPVFVWADFWYAIKRNWKQALIFGVIDVIIHGVLIYGIYYMFTISGESFFAGMVMWIEIAIFLLYFVMRFYIYIQIVTFKLSIFKILKNSLILALYGFKRNIMAVLGILVLVVIELMAVFALNGILISLGVGLPLLIMFSAMAYMKVYAAYFKIKEVMIDPYNAEHPEENPDEPASDEDDEIVMHDDVTERERIAEIRARNGLPPEDE